MTYQFNNQITINGFFLGTILPSVNSIVLNILRLNFAYDSFKSLQYLHIAANSNILD